MKSPIKISSLAAVGVRLSLAICLSAISQMGMAAQTAPHVGTWKLNAAQSTLVNPPPRDQTRTYVAFGDGLKASIETLHADGSRSTASYSARFDGKDYPYSGSQLYDSIVLKRVDLYTMEALLKKSGHVVQIARNAVSRNGKVMTVTLNGLDARGQKITTVTVLEKQ